MENTTNWIDIFEDNDWTVKKDENEYYVTWYSPEGEEFVLYLDGESPISDFVFQAESFNVDEHVEMWIPSRGTKGVPSSIRTLLKDAEAIKEELERIAELINE